MWSLLWGVREKCENSALQFVSKDSRGIALNLEMAASDLAEVPFLCAGFRLGQPEAALGGLLDILGMCPSIRTGLCGLVLLDIWMSGKESGGEQAKQ